MKILCIGDIHFKQTSLIPYYSKVDENGISGELNRAIKSLKFVEEKIKEIQPDIVVQLGDIFHTLGNIDSIVLVEAHKSIKFLYETCKEVNANFYIIGGNHDIYDNNRYTTEILPCDKHFSKPEVIEDNIRLGFVPYYDPEYKMNYVIQTIEADIVFTHTNVKGAFYNKVRKSDTGLDVNTIEENKLIISGHIHIPQQVGNVYYTGSLYQNTFSEQPINISFGITLLTISDKIEIQQIPNNAVDKFVILTKNNFDKFLSEVEDLDKYFIKLVSDDKELAEELSEYTDKFIFIPEYKPIKQIEKEYNLDYNNLDTKTIIKDYIKSNYPYLTKYASKLLLD